MTQPNIVVIQADQLTAKALSMACGRSVETPNVDEIAHNGVTLANGYCNNPVCGPSRASMITRQRSSAVGCYDNDSELLSSIPTFAAYLRHLGNAPALILVQDGLKYIHCPTDPPMLFDLRHHPDELHNLACDPRDAAAAARMKGEIDRHGHHAQLEPDILASQKRRRFVQEALLKGQWQGWDHQPLVDATRTCVRGAVDPTTTATMARRRLPFVAEVPPDHPRHGKPAIDLKPRVRQATSPGKGSVS